MRHGCTGLHFLFLEEVFNSQMAAQFKVRKPRTGQHRIPFYEPPMRPA
jgi:hypothetical protein